MKPRELAGAIRRAEAVYLWVQYTADRGLYLLVPKSTAREIVQDAYENSVEDIDAHLEGNDVHIGEEPDETTVQPGAAEDTPEEEEEQDDDPE